MNKLDIAQFTLLNRTDIEVLVSNLTNQFYKLYSKFWSLIRSVNFSDVTIEHDHNRILSVCG